VYVKVWYIAEPNIKGFNTLFTNLNTVLIMYATTSTKLVDTQAAKTYEFLGSWLRTGVETCRCNYSSTKSFRNKLESNNIFI